MDPRRPPPLKALRPGHWVAIDCAFTALLALAYVAGFKDLALLRSPHWLSVAIVAIAVLPVAARRFWPRTVHVLVVVGAAVATAISRSPHVALAVGFVVYLIPLRFPRREALWLLAGTLSALMAGLGAFVGVTNAANQLGDTAGLALQDGLLVVAAWVTGYAVRQQSAYAAGVHERAEQHSREQLAEARRVGTEERLQLARELHDVLAHTVSLIAVEAGVANYVITTHPEEAARALSSIETTSQIHGERRELSAGLDLAAYRVAQEAITNVIKHATTDRCRVTISYEQHALALEVTDGGNGACSRGGRPGIGHGWSECGRPGADPDPLRR